MREVEMSYNPHKGRSKTPGGRKSKITTPQSDRAPRIEEALRVFSDELRRLRLPKIQDELQIPTYGAGPSFRSLLDLWNATPTATKESLNLPLQAAVLDLIEFEDEFTKDFCEAMKIAFMTLQQSRGRGIVVWGAELDLARMGLLQAFVVLIDCLAAKSPVCRQYSVGQQIQAVNVDAGRYPYAINPGL
jgi:hypothetical protein